MQTLLKIARKPLFWCALAVVVIAGGLVAPGPREPVYEDKPLSYWLNSLPASIAGGSTPVYSLHPGNYTKSENAIKELGPHSLPTLVRRLRSKPTTIMRLKFTLQNLAAQVHLCRYSSIAIAPVIRRGQAVTALVLLGDGAKPVLPEVLTIAKSDPDPRVRASAEEVLRHLSPADYAQIRGQTIVDPFGL